MRGFLIVLPNPKKLGTLGPGKTGRLKGRAHMRPCALHAYSFREVSRRCSLSLSVAERTEKVGPERVEAYSRRALFVARCKQTLRSLSLSVYRLRLDTGLM